MSRLRAAWIVVRNLVILTVAAGLAFVLVVGGLYVLAVLMLLAAVARWVRGG